MHEAAGAPPQLTDGACGAAQSTGAAASRPILQARPLALRLHRERAIVAKNTDLCAADLHGGRAQRRDNRRPRMLARKRTHRASCSPGGGRPSSPPERPCPGSGIKGGVSVRPLPFFVCTCVFVVTFLETRRCLWKKNIAASSPNTHIYAGYKFLRDLGSGQLFFSYGDK